MTTGSASDSLKALALDLSRTYPRSPHENLAGFVHGGRALDKCRSFLAGTPGDYVFGCILDRMFFDFSGIKIEAFQTYVATGAADAAVAQWVQQHTTRTDEMICVWNTQMRDMRLSDLPIQNQVGRERFVRASVIPTGKRAYTWFDTYDIEEGRI